MLSSKFSLGHLCQVGEFDVNDTKITTWNTCNSKMAKLYVVGICNGKYSVKASVCYLLLFLDSLVTNWIM